MNAAAPNTEAGVKGTPAPAPAEEKPAAKKPAETETRYAVYDTAHERFVGPVLDKKADATADAKSRTKDTGRDHEVREV